MADGPLRRGGDERVCVVLLTGIGDVVHGLPVVNALKDDGPSRRITWVAEAAPAAVLQAHPSVEDVVVFRRTAGVRGLESLQRDFRGRRFDVTLNLNRHAKSIFPTVLSGAPVRIGLDRGKTRDGTWLACNRWIAPAPWAHTQELFLRFLDALHVPRPDPVEWRIRFTPEERACQAAFFSALPERPVVAMALGSKNPRKDWMPERYAELADRVTRDLGCTVLLVGGPAPRERAAAEEILAKARCGPVPALADDVRTLMWRVDGSDLLVSPDSGPLHIAHALDVPVVGMYGHSNPARVGPWSRFRDLVVDRYHDPGEVPDPTRTESRGRRMERVTVDEVADRVRIGFERYVLPRRSGTGA